MEMREKKKKSHPATRGHRRRCRRCVIGNDWRAERVAAIANTTTTTRARARTHRPQRGERRRGTSFWRPCVRRGSRYYFAQCARLQRPVRFHCTRNFATHQFDLLHYAIFAFRSAAVLQSASDECASRACV